MLTELCYVEVGDFGGTLGLNLGAKIGNVKRQEAAQQSGHILSLSEVIVLVKEHEEIHH